MGTVYDGPLFMETIFTKCIYIFVIIYYNINV